MSARATVLPILTGAVATCSPMLAYAHAVHDHAAPTLATAWTFDPWFLTAPTVAVVLYAIGLTRLWRRAGVGKGVGIGTALAFALGVGILFLALVWPLDAFGEWSLAAHMTQHMLLLAFAPPLLVAGNLWAVATHALPRDWSRWLHGAGSGVHARLLFALAAATLVQGLVMAVWHLPAATTLALRNDAVHFLMHANFFLVGLWFWSCLLRCIRDSRAGAAPAFVALVAVMMQMGLLGALLTFSRRALYPVYVTRAPALGLDPLVDQQLAGLIMWVPACVPYLIGGLWIVGRALVRTGPRDEGETGPAHASVHAASDRG